MKINRDARVRATDGELGRIRHVIVDPDTHELTDIVVGDDVREWLIPTSAVQNADGGEVTLAGSVNELTSTASHFDRDCYHGVDSGEVVHNASRQRARHGGAPLVDASERSVVIGGEGTTATSPVAQPENTSPYELQLKAERLQVNKEQQEAGRLRLRTETREHVETVEVPVREERLIIECLPGSGRVLVGDRELMAGETIELTLRRERVSVNKEIVATEDIHLRKEAVTRTEQIREPVREEQLAVDDPNGLVAGAEPANTAAREATPASTDAQFIARPPAAAGYQPDSPRPSDTDFSNRPAEFLEKGSRTDMYDRTPEPMEYASVRPDHERLPVMEDLMSDEREANRSLAADGSPEMQDIRQNEDRAMAESAARRAQSRPASSGQLNPGGEEYREQLPGGPAGTGGAIDSGVPQPAEKSDGH